MFSVKRDSWLTFIVCSVIGALVLIETAGYPVLKGQGFGRGPGFYPQVLAWAMIGLGLLILIQSLRRKKPDATGHADRPEPIPSVAYLPVAGLMLLAVASIVAMDYVGFLFSGFILTFLSVLLIRASLRGRHVVAGFIYSVGMLVLVYLVFDVFVGVQLPGSSLFK